MRHELAISQRQLGRLLHGGVQARLQSAALRLSRSDELSGETLQQVIADLDHAKSLLQRMEQTDGQALGAQLDDVIDFWDGVCDVDIVMSREFDETVSRDAVAAQCAIEVIREAISNAVKHGSAHSATVELSLTDNQEIDVRVSHSDQTDSALLLSNSGLGSHIYDELTNSWELSKSQGTVVFRAKISSLI
jgi:signal transduction histidine kinase